MHTISLLVRITASAEEVFEQISTAEGIANWFAEALFTTDEQSGKMSLQLWGETEFEVTELSPSSSMVWHCTSAENPWFGTDVIFQLRQEAEKTIVSFDHSGWPDVSELYRDCAMSWAYFLESLKSYIEDGVGTPEGVAPKCESTSD